MHPLISVRLSPLHACTPGLENPTTSVLSTLTTILPVCTGCAHRARAPWNNGVSPAKTETSARARPVHTSGLPPPLGEWWCADQGYQRPCAETVHALSRSSIKNWPQVAV